MMRVTPTLALGFGLLAGCSDRLSAVGGGGGSGGGGGLPPVVFTKPVLVQDVSKIVMLLVPAPFSANGKMMSPLANTPAACAPACWI